MNFITILSIIFLILIDQISKIWAVNTLMSGTDIQIIEGVFHLHYISNYGAAWGMLSGKQGFLIIFTSIIIIGMIYYMTQLPHTKEGLWTKIALIMIISGAIGNLIDRITLGYVRDFLYFILIDFPIFNVADILVVVGVAVLLIAIFIGDTEGNNEVQK